MTVNQIRIGRGMRVGACAILLLPGFVHAAPMDASAAPLEALEIAPPADEIPAALDVPVLPPPLRVMPGQTQLDEDLPRSSTLPDIDAAPANSAQAPSPRFENSPPQRFDDPPVQRFVEPSAPQQFSAPAASSGRMFLPPRMDEMPPVEPRAQEDRFAVPPPAPTATFQPPPTPALSSPAPISTPAIAAPAMDTVTRQKPAAATNAVPAPAAKTARDSAPRENAVEHAKKHRDPLYVCPMHPGFTTTNPSDNCPICGMKVVPVESGGDAEVVKLSPTIINSIGVRTERVKRGNLYRKVSGLGIIDYDQNKMRSITLRTEAWVERLRTKSVGEQIRKGDVLFDAYSPTLVAAQEEFLNALNIEKGDGQLVRATAQRLAAFGFSEQQIGRLRQRRKVEELLTFYAPFTGIVAELNIREGGYIAPATPVMVLADLSTVWLMVDVYENQIGLIEKGLQAEASMPMMGDKMLQGMVDYVYPTLDPKTRTIKVRVVFDNKDGLLKPNMYANATIYGAPRKKVLSVAREAIIRIGGRSRVIVSMGDGSFKPVAVMVGAENDERIEITGGLDEEAEVVVSSQFLIDSESSVRAALMRMGGL